MGLTHLAKIRVWAYVNENVYERLVSYISEAYKGSRYGALSQEIENAIVAYLGTDHTQIHANLDPTAPRVIQACIKIMGQLREKGFIKQVDFKSLGEIIGNVRGADKRTLTKWTKILLSRGYLKRGKTAYLYVIPGLCEISGCNNVAQFTLADGRMVCADHRFMEGSS